MKKLAIGCLVIALIGTVAIVAAVYFGYRAARPMLESASQYIEQAKAVAEVSDRVVNKTPFPAPADGELTEAQVQRFLSVHERVRATLGPRWSELQARAESIQEKAKGSSRDLSFSELTSVLSDLGGMLLDVRRAQADALNAEGFSLDEYGWVRTRVYAAAGLEVVEAIDWSAAQEMIRKGEDSAGVPLPEVKLPEVPERNRALVKPHVSQLKEWLPLAFLGM